MSFRDQLDQKAWGIIHSRTVSSSRPAGYARSGRPANYVELATMVTATGDFERAWSEFLQEFYRYKSVSFLELPVPRAIPLERRAFLAAAAEFLCLEFDLAVPSWTQEPEYFLEAPWDPDALWFPGVPEEDRRRVADPIFLRHNVLFPRRGMIAL